MNAPERLPLPLCDIQSSSDHRNLPIQRVGIKDIRYPIRVTTDDGAVQHTIAQVTMTVGLPASVKGTHMSRFVELLEDDYGPLDLSDLSNLARRMLTRLDADTGRIEFRFAYFIRKQAPVSGVASLIDVDVEAICEIGSDGQADTMLRVAVPVTSLCPCSKEISAYGAHNQRSRLTVDVTLRAPVSIEALVRIAEQEASCEVFGLLKRTDEKWVTERAYDNPKFVEDLVRDVALRLQGDRCFARWSVSSENFESIHNHSAFALLEGSNA